MSRMRLRLEEPALVDDLISFLDRCGCRTERLAGGIVEVTPTRPDDLDLLGYLRVWGALRSAAPVVVDDRSPTAA